MKLARLKCVDPESEKYKGINLIFKSYNPEKLIENDLNQVNLYSNDPSDDLDRALDKIQDFNDQCEENVIILYSQEIYNIEN